ncbi:MAG: tetratricopeptide repeat protein [Planctomycetaceae bacterium]|nr:tetratricopeptide repeat protein [Planctomycetaceae bacterium]
MSTFLSCSDTPAQSTPRRTNTPTTRTATAPDTPTITSTTDITDPTSPLNIKEQPAAAPRVAPEIEQVIKSALEIFAKSDFNGAHAVLAKLYEEHPELPPPRIILAQWFAQAEAGNAIKSTLDLATAETPNDPEAYILLGEISLRQRELTASELLLKHAETKLAAYSANPERKKNMTISLLRNLASLAESRNRWSEFESVIDKRIALEGESATLLRQKGIALFQQKKDTEAMQLLIKADNTKLAANETGLPAEAMLARLYLLRGDNENAKKFLTDALAKHPDSKEVIFLSIQARLNEDKLEEARDLAEKLRKDFPTYDAAARIRATIALYLGEFELAEKLFQEMVVASPTDEQAANGLALALCEQKDQKKIQRAIDYAKENVRKNQQSAEFWGTLGWVLYNANQFEQAQQAFKQSAGLGQISAATAYYIARLAIKTEKPKEAKQLLEAAINSTSPFAKRRDAKKLLDELNK